MKNDFAQLQELLGYKFNDISLLEQALCHKSYINESKRNVSSYERLEFWGDSVLSVVVSRYIYDNYSSFPEGELTKLRASVVCENTLSDVARKLNRLPTVEELLTYKGKVGRPTNYNKEN